MKKDELNVIFKQSGNIQKYKNMAIIVSIINLIIYVCNLYYLHNLKECVCFKILNSDKKINLNYLLAINYILLFFLIVNIISINKNQTGGASTKLLLAIFSILLLLYISIYTYYIYNIYKIYKKDNISKYCDCLESKFKYSLYIHGILLTIGVIISSIIFMFAFIFILIRIKK